MVAAVGHDSPCAVVSNAPTEAATGNKHLLTLLATSALQDRILVCRHD